MGIGVCVYSERNSKIRYHVVWNKSLLLEIEWINAEDCSLTYAGLD
jgi:hypothetical protein